MIVHSTMYSLITITANQSVSKLTSGLIQDNNLPNRASVSARRDSVEVLNAEARYFTGA